MVCETLIGGMEIVWYLSVSALRTLILNNKESQPLDQSLYLNELSWLGALDQAERFVKSFQVPENFLRVPVHQLSFKSR